MSISERLMAVDWRERWRTLSFTYAALLVGLLAALLTRSAHLHTLNFWLTAAAAFLIVTCFDLFVLGILDDERLTPSQFLLRMMVLVVGMQTLFAGIYFWASTETTCLVRSGARVTEFVDALYFSGVTLLTVGYGDVTPIGDFRFTAMAEVYGGTLFIFAFFTWGLSVIATRHLRRRKPR